MADVIQLSDFRADESELSAEEHRAAYRRFAEQKVKGAMDALARNEPLTAKQRFLVFMAARHGQRSRSAES